MLQVSCLCFETLLVIYGLIHKTFWSFSWQIDVISARYTLGEKSDFCPKIQFEENIWIFAHKFQVFDFKIAQKLHKNIFILIEIMDKNLQFSPVCVTQWSSFWKIDGKNHACNFAVTILPPFSHICEIPLLPIYYFNHLEILQAGIFAYIF